MDPICRDPECRSAQGHRQWERFGAKARRTGHEQPLGTALPFTFAVARAPLPRIGSTRDILKKRPRTCLFLPPQGANRARRRVQEDHWSRRHAARQPSGGRAGITSTDIIKAQVGREIRINRDGKGTSHDTSWSNGLGRSPKTKSFLW